MKNQEIDNRIAIEIMGWQKRQAHFHPSNPEYWFDGSERQIIATAWHPSTDIAQAWEVVEKIGKDTDIYFEVCRYGNGEWVTFMGQGNEGFEVDKYADTAPLAICKAALKAVEGK